MDHRSGVNSVTELISTYETQGALAHEGDCHRSRLSGVTHQDSLGETVSVSHQRLKPRSMAKTIAWARVHTPSLSKRLET